MYNNKNNKNNNKTFKIKLCTNKNNFGICF